MTELFKTHVNGQWSILEKNSTNDQELGTEGQDEDSMKFSPSFGQKDFRKYVEEHADHFPKKGLAKGDLKDFEWTFDPDFKVSELKPIKSDWKGWYISEIDEYQWDHGKEKADEKRKHFEDWVKSPHYCPAIVIERTNGKYAIIDAHHRIAVSIIKEMKTIPVICGKRKK